MEWQCNESPVNVGASSEAHILSGLAPVVSVDVARIREAIARDRRVVVVLDDDPTGTQTVADVPVLTTWSVDDVRWAMRQPSSVFYILTNSRSLDPDSADRRVREVMRSVCDAARDEGREFVVTSRSDSTLRGHFPLEPDAIAECLAQFTGSTCDGVVIVPAYVEAGRLTIESVHYLRTGNGLVPVGESEFARDATFGYHSSDLRDYVQEKSTGRWMAADVARVTLTDLRVAGLARVKEILEGLTNGRPVVVDAVCDDDLRLLTLAILDAESGGKRFIYRVGPSFVRARAGLDVKLPLTSEEIGRIRSPDNGGSHGTATSSHGLIVVGSHVSMSTRQLEGVMKMNDVKSVEVDVLALLGEDSREATIDAVVRSTVDGLATSDVVVGTSRELALGHDADESLAIARSISSGLAEIVRRVVSLVTPGWVVGKGGITSSDVATSGLGVRRAWARGTLLPGIISLWQPVTESGPTIPYVVFAGNVGDEGALVTVVKTLRGSV